MKKRIKDLTKEEIERLPDKDFITITNYNGRKARIFKTFILTSLYGTIDIPDKHILDKEEHDYLRAVCKPYIKDIKKLIKRDYGNYVAYIELTKFTTLTYTNENSFQLPFFDSQFMYKGMETNRCYTIEELELDKEWNND